MIDVRSYFTVLLATALSLAHLHCFAEDPTPSDGRVPLIIKAADPNGGKFSFNWKQTEGPQVEIAKATSSRYDDVLGKWISEAYFIPKEPGKYIFEVTVKNEDGMEAKRLIVQEVLAAIPAPVADPGPDQRNKKLRDMIVISGQNSKASAPRFIKEYQWRIKKAPAGFTLPDEKLRARQFDFVAALDGQYEFELVVNDGKKSSEPASVIVEVKKGLPPKLEETDSVPKEIELPEYVPTRPPVSRPRLDPGVGRAAKIGETIVLDGSKSIVDLKLNPGFLWIQKNDDLRSPVIKTLSTDLTKPFDRSRTDAKNYPVWTFIANQPGTYKFVLSVTVTSLPTPVESEVIEFTVTGPGQVPQPPDQEKRPVVIVTQSAKSVAPGQEVLLDASRSYSSIGAPLQFYWEQVPTKKFPIIRGRDGARLRVSADAPGEYWITLSVTDGKSSGRLETPIVFSVTAANQPPVINVQNRNVACNIGETIVMSVTVTDPDNDPFELLWTCVEPAGINIPREFATKEKFRFQPNRAGTFLFKIEATDDPGNKSSALIQVGVADPRIQAPTAIVTGTESAFVGDNIVLSGAQSYDPNDPQRKQQLSFFWKSEPEGAKIDGDVPGRARPEWRFTAKEPGRYVISLVVSNGTSYSAPTKWAVEVQTRANTPVPTPENTAGGKTDLPSTPPNSSDPQPPRPAGGKPVAMITGPRIVNVGDDVVLSAATSTSADGSPLQYSWSQPFDGGPDLKLMISQLAGKELRFKPSAPGTYVLNLEVSDQNRRRSELAVYSLEVRGSAAPPVPPTPVAAPPKAVALLMTREPLIAGKEVRLSATRSVDPAGGQLTYKWLQTTGPDKIMLLRDNTEEIAFTPVKPGNYDFMLTVISSAGLSSAPTPIALTITAPAVRAVANIAEIPPPMAGDRIILDGTGSTVSPGARPEYKWSQKSGPPVRLMVGDDTKPKLEITLPDAGDYVFELKVLDGADWSDPATLAFTAKGRAKNIPPIVRVEKTNIVTEVDAETIIDATASEDPDKGPQPLQFIWLLNDREMSEKGPVLKVKPPLPGLRIYTVKAFDGKDFSEPVTVSVDVRPTGAIQQSVPIAKASVKPNPAKKAIRGGDNTLKTIVLDGGDSTPPGKIEFEWSQTAGENLGLKADQLAKEKVGLRVYKPGTYRFQLIVIGEGGARSKPASVELIVEDE